MRKNRNKNRSTEEGRFNKVLPVHEVPENFPDFHSRKHIKIKNIY